MFYLYDSKQRNGSGMEIAIREAQTVAVVASPPIEDLVDSFIAAQDVKQSSKLLYRRTLRLSLGEVKLPAPEVREREPLQVDRPPTDEEIAYSSLLAINPFLADLVTSLDLVSGKTGDRIREVELKPEYRQERTPPQVDKTKLLALAQRTLQGETTYSRSDVVARIMEATTVSSERANRGFTMMLQAGVIEPTLEDNYYLTGSTPF
jgi:hypothetical protein